MNNSPQTNANPSTNLEQVHLKKSLCWQSEAKAERFLQSTKQSHSAISIKVVCDIFGRYCRPGDKVLDAGCATGSTSYYLHDIGCDVVSMDISQQMLDVLERNKGQREIELRRGDVCAIPAQDGEFDVVTARMFINHVPKWKDAIREMARVCKPGGTVIYNFHSSENRDIAVKYANREYNSPSTPNCDEVVEKGMDFMGECSKEEAIELSRELGFSHCEVIPCLFMCANYLLGHSMGTDKFNEFQVQMNEWIESQPVIGEFYRWLESTMVEHLPIWATLNNVTVMRNKA